MCVAHEMLIVIHPAIGAIVPPVAVLDRTFATTKCLINPLSNQSEIVPDGLALSINRDSRNILAGLHQKPAKCFR